MPTPLTNQLEELRNQADRWIARLNSDLCKNHDRQQFSAWLQQSPAHRQAFDQQLDLFQQLGALDGLSFNERRTTQRREPATIPVNGIAEDRRGGDRRGQPPNASPRQPAWRLLTSWAPFVCAAVVVMAFFWPTSQNTNRLHYSTGAGEVRTLQLSDGSRVQLNTRSALSVDFSEGQRQLTLTRGEAYFDVAKDPQRPFIVHLGDTSVTAVGTAFNIYRQEHNSQVHLTEGVISVAAAKVSEAKEITAGQRFELSAAGISKLTRDSVQPDWLDGNLDFNNTPLSTAIGELNRHLRQPVQLEMTREQQLQPLSGHFTTGEAEATLRAIALSLNLTLERNNGQLTLRAL